MIDRRQSLFGALALAAGGALALGAWGRRTRDPGLEFDPVPHLPGFRRLRSDILASVASPAIAGIDEGSPSDDPGIASTCAALYGADVPAPGVVPVALFTDIRCPHCRVLESRLLPLMASGPVAARLVWHDWPVFGASSEAAARAIVAAERQGSAERLRDRLHRAGFVVDGDYLVAVSRELGMDDARLLADMAAPETAARLRQTGQLATRLGFPGTPGLVIGRTIVDGAVPAAVLSALLVLEAGSALPCAG